MLIDAKPKRSRKVKLYPNDDMGEDEESSDDDIWKIPQTPAKTRKHFKCNVLMAIYSTLHQIYIEVHVVGLPITLV